MYHMLMTKKDGQDTELPHLLDKEEDTSTLKRQPAKRGLKGPWKHLTEASRKAAKK